MTDLPVVWSVVGARPQFVKAAVMSRALARHGRVRELLIHTGQHYDANMSAHFFRDLDIPKPAFHLGVGSCPPGTQVGRMLEAMEEALGEAPPKLILTFGDTNSTLAGALLGAYHHLPVAHVEAGLRSYNWAMPEEINRVVTDRLSSLLFCPSEVAKSNLASEGIVSGVHVVGDIMLDAVLHYQDRAGERAKAFLAAIAVESDFVLATIHRAENTDDASRLGAIFAGLGRSPWPVVLPLHPRTREAMARAGIEPPANVRVCEPVGYLEMLGLESLARAIVTDSGGVQKEAYFAATPCLTARDETEWVETVEANWNRLVGCRPDAIARGLDDVAAGRFPPSRKRLPLYGDGAAGERMAALVAETCGAQD